MAGSCEGLIAVLDLNQGTTTRIINDHKTAPITSLESVYDSIKQTTYWLAASKDRRVSIWSSKLKEDLYQIIDWLTFPFEYKTKNVSSDRLVKKTFWSEQPNVLAMFAHCDAKTSPDTLIVIGNDTKKQIVFYNFIKKQIVRTMELTEYPQCVSKSPRSNLIAFGTKSRLLQLKDYNRATFQDYAQHSDSVSSVCFSNDCKRLFTAAFNEIFIWDILI